MIRSYQGHTPRVPASCYVDQSAQVLGDVSLGEHSSVWMNAVLRGDVHSIRVGANSNVQDCAVLHGQRHLYAVTVGDWVTIGHNATVHGCTVEDAVLIGMGVVILNDCRIGEGSILAAGMASAADIRIVEEIICKVNGDIITKGEMERQHQTLEMALRQ